MTIPLESLADLSNIFAVFLVLSCLFTMVTYIIRLQHIPSSVVRVTQHVSPQPMLRVRNPFTCNISGPRESSLAGLKLCVTTEVPCMWQAYWGVPVNSVHQVLNLPWETLRNLLQEDSLLETGCLSRTEKQQLGCVTNYTLEVAPDKEITSQAMGPPPRTRYPLAFFMVQTQSPEDDNPFSVVAMLVLVHIKDAVCDMATNILGHYLKQANGAVYCLKPLYMVSSSSSDQEGEENSPSSNVPDLNCENELCVVCQMYPITRALLPCRHTCICATCFRHLDKCPLCRSFISSYFLVREEVELPETPLSQAEEVYTPRTWSYYWEHLNQRLNEYLGIS